MLHRFFSAIGSMGRPSRETSLSDVAILQSAPLSIAREIARMGVVCLPPSRPPKQHHRYLLGEDLMLHVYGASAHDALPRSVPERLDLQQCDVPGLCRLLQVEFTPEWVWLLEERLHGVQGQAGLNEATVRNSVEALVAMARLTGPPLAETRFWQEHAAEAIEHVPAALAPAVAQAWEEVADIPSAALHGDARPKNLIIGPRGIGLVDWEGFWRNGLPGLDIAYLLTMNARGGLDPIVADMVTGRPNRRSTLLGEALLACGYSERTLRPALLVMLSLWSLGEVRRMRLRTGAAVETRFLDLLRSAAGRSAV